MPIRLGLKLVLGLCLLYLAVSNYLIIKLFWFPVVDAYEEQSLDRSARDTEMYFRKVFDQTSAVARDYAYWELACSYVKSEDTWGKLPELESFDTVSLGVDFMAVVGIDGSPIISKVSVGVPENNESLTPLFAEMAKRFVDDREVFSGTLFHESIPMYVTIAPIREGADGTRCPGYVITGKLLSGIADELFNVKSVEVGGDSFATWDFQAAGVDSALTHFSNAQSAVLSERQIRFGSFEGSQPAVIMHVLMQRELLRLLKQVSGISSAIAVGAWLFMAILVYFFVNRFALERIAQASREARDLAMDDNLQRNLPLHAGKELRELVDSFNMLLDKRRDALSALVVNERQKNELFDNALDAIISIDADGLVCATNKAAESMLGYGREELLGADAVELLVSTRHHKRYRNAIGRYFKGKTFPFLGRLMELDITRKGGDEFTAEVNIVLTSAGLDKSLFTAFIRDITERRKFVERVIDSQKIEILGHLTGQLAHDFNNILGVTLASMQLLEMDAELDDRCSARLSDAQEACWKGAQLIKRLLAVARRQETQKEVFSVRYCVEEMLPLLQSSVGEEIRPNFLSGDFCGEVYADRSGFESCLLNLISNARDAVEHSGEISIMLAMGRAESGERVATEQIMLSVKDEGCGMDEKVASRAFEPFFTTKPTGKGTGLGLAMVYAYAHENGGKATLYSKPGQGTTVRLALPAVKMVSLAKPTPGPQQVLRGQGQRILLVDDQEGIRASILEMLRKLGYMPTAVASAEEGLAAIEKSSTGSDGAPGFDLVLSDVIMPGMGGSNLRVEVTQRWPELPVVFMTGYSDGRLDSDGVEPSDRILKPFGFKQLADFLHYQFEKRETGNI